MERVPAVDMKSPCTLVCTIDTATGYCFGCGRTLAEIAAWTTVEPAERDRILAELPSRMDRFDK